MAGVVCFCNHGAARARDTGGGRADRTRGEAGRAAGPSTVLLCCRAAGAAPVKPLFFFREGPSPNDLLG